MKPQSITTEVSYVFQNLTEIASLPIPALSAQEYWNLTDLFYIEPKSKSDDTFGAQNEEGAGP